MKSVTIRYLPGTAQDLLDARSWYDSKVPGLGDDLLQAFWDAIDIIFTHPKHCPITFDNVRRKILNRFPYAIYYTNHENLVLVTAVLHMASDPDFIKSSIGERMN